MTLVRVPRPLRTRRFLLLISQLSEELGSLTAAAEFIGFHPTYVNQLRKHAHRDVGARVLGKARQKLRLSSAFFDDPSLGDAPNYREHTGVAETHIELDHDDTAAWLELRDSGRLDAFRARGVSDEQIEHVRRARWDGTPSPRDYERLLDAYLLGPRKEPDAAREARERVEAEGGPKLGGLLK